MLPLLLLATLALHADTADGERPNFVVILADDLGYGDLACYGAADVHTPALDRLARQGVRLTDCYANGCVCSPTRAALMTGRYQQRIGLEWAVYYQFRGVGLPPREKSLATMLREAGYATAMVGKWHLGYDDWSPPHHGFERFFGSHGGNIHYFEHYDRKGVPDLFLGEEPVKRDGYATDLTAEYAVKFLHEMAAGDRPFFLFVPLNAPHFPYQGPSDADRDVTPQKGWQEGDRKTYAAMVESMDAAVGRIVEEVDRLGFDEKTLIVFTSDNGGAKFARNAPCSKGKGTLWEGGIRVPGIVRWTGTLPAGKVSGQVVATFDWTRTIVELAGGEAPADRPPDGINLLKPLRRGEAVKRTLFWRRRVEPIRKNVDPHRAVRHGRWKYIDRPDGTQYVYDLSRDVGETQNLIDAHADRAAHLKKLLDAWEADLDPPLYDQRAASLAAQRRAKAARSDK